MRLIAILCCLICGFCSSHAASDARPTSSDVMGAAYPRVDSENRVTFHLRAPDAQKVQVQVYHGRYEMTNDGAALQRCRLRDGV